MRMKRTLYLVLSIIFISCSLFALTVSAAARPPVASPQWNCTTSVYFDLNITDDRTGYISTGIQGDPGTTITATTQLYYLNENNVWLPYGSANKHVSNSFQLAATDTYTDLPAGKYKATLSGHVYGSGTSDYITFSDIEATKTLSNN